MPTCDGCQGRKWTPTPSPSSSDSLRGRKTYSRRIPYDTSDAEDGSNTTCPTSNKSYVLQHPTHYTSVEAVCDFYHSIDPARMVSRRPLLRDSLDGFLGLVTTVFLDSIVFFLALGFCVLAPRVFTRITTRFARWKLNIEDQKTFHILATIVLVTAHSILTLLLALDDDTGVTPNAPSVFWAIMWSTGIMVGILAGFLTATVVALCGMQMIGF